MASNYDVNTPIFTTEGGVRLHLRRVSQLKMMRYRTTWEAAHPAPRPEIVTLSNGDSWQNFSEPGYQAAASEWETRANIAMLNWTMETGVVTNPPTDWVSEFGLASTKVDWLYEILADEQEMMTLNETITSLGEITQAGLEAAQKN